MGNIKKRGLNEKQIYKNQICEKQIRNHIKSRSKTIFCVWGGGGEEVLIFIKNGFGQNEEFSCSTNAAFILYSPILLTDWNDLCVLVLGPENLISPKNHESIEFMKTGIRTLLRF